MIQINYDNTLRFHCCCGSYSLNVGAAGYELTGDNFLLIKSRRIANIFCNCHNE